MKAFIWGLLARFLAKPAIADWIIRRAKKTPYFHLASPDGQDVYMERYWLLNPYDRKTNKPRFSWLPWSVRLHIIRREDQERHLHDHPWNARTIILRGGYHEARLASAPWKDYMLAGLVPDPDPRFVDWVHNRACEYTQLGRGDTAALKFGEYHRITHILGGAAYTIFITGPYQGTWGFLVDGVKVQWRKYLGIPEDGDIEQADVCDKSPTGEHGAGPAPKDHAEDPEGEAHLVCVHCGRLL